MKPNELNQLGKFGGPPETRTPDPLIKSQAQSEPEQNINKKIQLFRAALPLYSTMAGVCSAQVQAQNEHSRRRQGLKDRPSPCRRPLPILISTKAGLYITS